jgi:chromosome segregation ATPase
LITYIESLQASVMEAKTLELQDNVRQAEEEAEKVRREKNALIQKWNASIVNVAKRDEAIAGFREALAGQELAARTDRAAIAETKREIVACQERHDHLSVVEQRTETLCASRRAHIR